MGFFRIERGKNALSIESGCAWATPGSWTELNTQVRCYVDGSNCQNQTQYTDPYYTYGK